MGGRIFYNFINSSPPPTPQKLKTIFFLNVEVGEGLFGLGKDLFATLQKIIRKSGL